METPSELKSLNIHHIHYRQDCVIKHRGTLFGVMKNVLADYTWDGNFKDIGHV